PSSVDLSQHYVDACVDGDDIRQKMAFDHLRDRRKIDERRRPNAPPYRFGSSVGDHIVALLSPRAFHGNVPLAGGRTRPSHPWLKVMDMGFQAPRPFGLGRKDH